MKKKKWKEEYANWPEDERKIFCQISFSRREILLNFKSRRDSEPEYRKINLCHVGIAEKMGEQFPPNSTATSKKISKSSTEK